MPLTSQSDQPSQAEQPPNFFPGYAFKPPEPVKLSKNGIENWKLWKQLWKHYCVVSGTHERTTEFQKSLLLSSIGIEALQVYNGCDPLETDTVSDILLKLDKHILGETNETFERYKFNTRSQKPDETIDDYLASLKTLAKTMTMRKIPGEPDENVSLMKSSPFVQLEYERSTQRLYKSFVQKDSCNFSSKLAQS